MLDDGGNAVALASAEMELNLIGNAVRDNRIVQSCGVDQQHFSIGDFAEVWGMLQAAVRRGETVTAGSFRAFLGGHGLEGLGKQIALSANEGWAISDPDDYGRTIRLECQRRKARAAAEDLVDGLTGPQADIGHAISQAVRELRDSMEIRELAGVGEVHQSILDKLDQPVRRWSTGLAGLDRITLGGLQAGMFYGLGGRFKAGKSFFLTTVSYNMLSECRHVYLTLESNKEQLFERMLARSMGDNANVFLDPQNRQNPGFRNRVDGARQRLNDAGFFMQTVPRMDLASLRSTLEQAVIKHGIQGAMVDYMQLVGGDPRVSKALHYEDVAQTLSELTREFGIWIVAAAQMNQEGNVRWGEGLLLACDMALILNKCEDQNPGVEPGDSWLEMRASRYTKVEDWGAPDQPVVRLDGKIGPHFRDLT